MANIWKRIIKIVAICAVVGGGLALVATQGQDTVTRPRLERVLPRIFTNLYAEQAAVMGRTDLDVTTLDPQAMCDKHGPLVADVGPGGDWTCLMSWHDPKVPMPIEGYGKFELNVHANDCFTATGPTKLTGYLTIPDASGADVTNPLFEFDGCFDPNGDNTATGVSFPSLMAVTSTSLLPDASGSAKATFTCSLGDGGCAGSVSAVSDDGRALGTASYDSEEGRTVSLTFAGVGAAKSVTFTVVPTKGRGPADPVVVPVGAG